MYMNVLPECAWCLQRSEGVGPSVSGVMVVESRHVGAEIQTCVICKSSALTAQPSPVFPHRERTTGMV